MTRGGVGHRVTGGVRGAEEAHSTTSRSQGSLASEVDRARDKS